MQALIILRICGEDSWMSGSVCSVNVRRNTNTVNVRRNTKVRRWLRLWHYPTNIANKFTLPQPPAYPKQKKC